MLPPAHEDRNDFGSFLDMGAARVLGSCVRSRRIPARHTPVIHPRSLIAGDNATGSLLLLFARSSQRLSQWHMTYDGEVQDTLWRSWSSLVQWLGGGRRRRQQLDGQSQELFTPSTSQESDAAGYDARHT